MLSQTKKGLEEFDNQHDFERMAADILNALGYQNVEPMAPGGGSDGGQDIKFRDGDTQRMAFVTLEKAIGSKFGKDLAKQKTGEGVIALFCNVNLSPKTKLVLAKKAFTRGYTLELFDLERLRSLLDASLKEIRRRYLKIDDEVSARLGSEIRKLCKFPDATPDSAVPPSVVEQLLVEKLPRRLFELLIQFEEKDILEVPGIGVALQEHLNEYYRFRKRTLEIEGDLARIGQLVSVQFAVAWQIYLRYVLMRFGGASQGTIVSWGSFLNYEITWDGAERVFSQLLADSAVSSAISKLFEMHTELSRKAAELQKITS